jgi:hypothetical protein
MPADFDSSLAQWLTRIGVAPFRPERTVSPVINFLLSRYSYPSCQKKLKSELPMGISIEDVFHHCGVPNALLAHINADRIIESLHLHGERLNAHPAQRPFLSKTSISSVIDYVHEEHFPALNADTLDTEDAKEFASMKEHYSVYQRPHHSLRLDPGFMLYKSIADFLNDPADDHLFTIAVSLKPFVNMSLIKLTNAFNSDKTANLPIDMAQLVMFSHSQSSMDLAGYLSDICPIPFSLTPSRYALITTLLHQESNKREILC